MASAIPTETVETLCFILSTTVFIVCLVLKLPQITSVYREKCSKGLSTNSVRLELLGYSIMLAYHFAMGYPLSTYIEYCFLVPQDIILLALVLQYTGKLSMNTIAMFVCYLAVCIAFAFRMVPELFLTASIGFNAPVSMVSKALQILTLIRTRDAGNVSAATWGMATYSTLARSLTTLFQTGDLAVLGSFSISFLLNGFMTSLIVYLQAQAKKTKAE